MNMLFRSTTLLLLFLQAVFSAEHLTRARFEELTTGGKNGMIKFYQPWCGHCTAMKPAWDEVASEAHPSVFIADINCSDEEELCSENGVQGYPTIKVYKDGAVESYEGGRDVDSLKAFVDESLAVKCDVTNVKGSGCSEKAVDYIAKWSGKDRDALKKEHVRLAGMSGKSMKADLKQWMAERISILRQMTEQCNVNDPKTSCSEKAVDYIQKWKDKDAASIKKELDRLTKMTGDVMTDDLKEWLLERITVLKQIGTSGDDEL